MRFGLERISRLVSVLGMPQHRFASVHVVGTNGKSSVTEIAAALLEAHGVRAGAYLSPHDRRWRERIRVGGAELAEEAFGAAAERVAQAVEVVNRTLDEGESVTQFEADTATAFVALAAARVEVAVIEAGLGGRLDATNVIPSRVTVLTSVGLEHTEYLGDTEVEIAAEKLAVLRAQTTLVIGPLAPEVERVARRAAAERGAELVSVRDLAPVVELPTASALPAPQLRRRAGRRRGDPRLARPRAGRATSPRGSTCTDGWRWSTATLRWSSTPPTTRPAPGRWPRRCPRWRRAGP